MKSAKNNVRKFLSVLLSILLAVTALPLLSFRAAAGPSAADYNDLAAALRNIPDTFAASIRNNVRGNEINPSSTNRGSYVGENDRRTNATDYSNDSSPGSWVVSTGGQKVWDALKLYGGAAAAIRNDTGLYSNVSIKGSGDHGRREGPKSGDTFTDGTNYTAIKIRDTIRTGIGGMAADPRGALNYFSGNFRVNSSGSNEAAYDLLDTPRAMWYSNSITVGAAGSDSKYICGWRQSPGGFAVLRTPLEAVLAGSADLGSFGVSAVYNTALELYYHHAAAQTGSWVYNDTNWANTGTRYTFRFSWHYLDAAPALREGTAVTNPFVGAGEKTVSLNTQVLKNWKAATPDITDWTSFSYHQLAVMRTAYDSAKTAMGSTNFATTAGNGNAVHLFHSSNAGVLEHFGLRDLAWGEAYRARIEEEMAARLVSDYGEYFHAPASGRLTTAPTDAFNSRVPSDTDPRGGYAGMDALAQLSALYNEALVKHQVLMDAQANEPGIWAALLAQYPAMDTGAQANWLGNLKWVERIWRLLDVRDETIAFLENTANYHEGVNPNILMSKPFTLENPDEPLDPEDPDEPSEPLDPEDPDEPDEPLDPEYPDEPSEPLDPEDPDEPSDPFGDSEYVHDNQAIALYIETAAGNYGFLQNIRALAGDYSGLVSELFVGYGGRDLEAELHARWLELLDEKAYRWDTWHSEEYWYSYRDFFTPLYGRDFVEMTSEELMRLYQSEAEHANAPKPQYQGVHKNVEQYQKMSAAAAAALSPERWAEIYGGYEDVVIQPVVDNIFHVLAARLTLQVDRAMKIINGLKEANEISISRPHPGQGEITILQWSTFGQIKKAIDLLDYNVAGKDVYAFLQAYDKLGLLGFDGPPAYPSNEVRDDYWFLLGEVIPAYNEFMANPHLYFKQTPLTPPLREPWEGDILPGHKYTDESAPGAHDDPAMKELIDRLDTLLGAGGDLRPLLSALDLSDLGIDLATMGIDANAPGSVNLTSVVDTALDSLLFNDKTLNMVVEALYPMILNMLEDMFLSQVIPMIEDINPNVAQTSILGMTVGVTSLNVKYYHLYTLLSGTQSGNTFNQLRLYPDLLNSVISTQFPNVKAALSSAKAHVKNYPQKSKEYPTNAWADAKNPGLYRTNPETGERELWLDWGIDAIDDPARKATQFKLALSNILQGVFPLLGALLLNKNYDNSQNTALKHPSVAHADIKTNVVYYTDNAPIEIQLRVKGVPGYAKIITPILECLAGTDADLLNTIPTMAQLNGYTSASQLVDAIFNPLMGYIERVKAKPVTEILALLPNLCYALSLERVPALFRDLNIKMSYWADACLIQSIGWPYLSTFGAAIEGELPAINLSDMLLDGGLGLDKMLTMDGIMDLLFGVMGSSLELPPFNAGRIATYGKIQTLSSKRAPSGTQRHYIAADRPDVMQAFLGWLLGAGLFPLNGTPTEAVAAILELVAPTGYPPKPVAYSEPDWPDYNPFPAWWADLNSPAGRDRAKLDADYLVANADTVLNVLWRTLFPDSQLTFAQGIVERFQSMGANGEFYASVVETIQRLIRELIGQGGMLEKFKGLFSSLALIDGEPFDITAAANRLLDYQIPPAEDVDTVSELVDELVKFLAPIVPVLDILMSGANLDLINVDTRPGNPPKGLAQALLGGAGFEGGIRPVLEALTKPLGLPPAAAWAGTPEQKLRALLDPIENVYYKILEKPVDSLLALLPSLAYFTTENGGSGSPLQQSLDFLLNPLYVLFDTMRPIIDIDLNAGTLPGGITLSFNEGLRLNVEALLNDLLSGVDLGGPAISLELRKFLLGSYDSGAFTADKGAVLFALLDQLGLLRAVVDLEMTGLTKLIQYERFPGPQPIDYGKGAPAADRADPPGWFRASHAEYLTGNADAVLKWAWRVMIAEEPTVKAYLQNLLGGAVTIEDSLEETVDSLFGHDLYVKENLPKLVGMILGIRDSLDNIQVPAIEFLGNRPLSLTQAMAKLMFIYDDSRLEAPIPLDLHVLMAPMDAFMAAYEADPSAALAGVTGAESFTQKLVELFSPLMPLLRVLLAESNALLIVDDDITSDDNAFLRAYGYNGYETGLLPILLGFGADIPGFADQLLPYGDFRAASEEEQLQAILKPILYLIDALAGDPVQTLLRVLPNAAYFISDVNGDSLLRQAVAKLLHPITVLLDEANIPGTEGLLDSFTNFELGGMANALLADLIGGIDGLNAFEIEELVIGTITAFDAPYNEMGLRGEASYVEADLAGLLVKLLDVTGAFGLIEDSGFAGLIELLNVDDRVKADGPAPLDYGKAPKPAAVQWPSWLSQTQAQFLADNADGILNWAWRELIQYENKENKRPVKAYLEDLLGIPLASTLAETVDALLGDNLFTQGNFDGIVSALAGLKGTLDGIEFAGLTLPQILAKAAVIDGGPIDLDAMFAPLMAHAAGGAGYMEVTAADFVGKLAELLMPFMPLLNVLLAEADMKFIVDDSVNDGKGFLVIDGYDGYQSGLLPILLGLGADVPGFMDTLVPYGAYLALDNGGRMEAILTPLLFLLNQLAADPLHTVMRVLPNAAYFIGAGKGPSLLSQAVDNMLHPIAVLLGCLPEGTLDLNLGELLETQLAGLLKGLPFPLEALAVGGIKIFPAPWNALGLDGKASYVDVDEAGLLVQLLILSGALDALDEETLAGLMGLLNLDNTRPDGPGRIDYSKATVPVAPGSMYPPWLKKEHMAFLADNADGIVNWAWRALVKGNAALKDSIGFPLEDSLEDTVHGLLGSYLYTSGNLDMIVSAVLGLKAQLAGVELAGMSLIELLEAAVRLYDESTDTYRPLDIAALFERFEAYVPGTPVAGPEAFRDALADLLAPLVPLLRVFLTEGDLVFIADPEVNDNKGLVKIFGSNGYETALLPLLLGLGAGIDGFKDCLLEYGDFKALNDADMLGAILDPLLLLLDRLTRDPVNTALEVLPNAAYFTSLLPQAIDNLLFPLGPALRAIPGLDIDLGSLDAAALLEDLLGELPFRLEDLVVGEVTVFGEPWKRVGLHDKASYLAVDRADLLAQLLKAFGAFELLEENNLTGLISLLDPAAAEGPGPVRYPQVNTAVSQSIYKNCWWTKRQATEMAGRAGEFLDGLWTILYGKPFGEVPLQAGGNAPADSFLRDLIGSALYTEDNFNKLLDMVQGAIPALADMEIVPGRTLGDLLRASITVGGKQIDLMALLGHLATWKPSGNLNTQAGFTGNLAAFLEPLTPLLDFILFGEDIVFLEGEAGINDGKGLARISGYNGYQYGLVPIYEALLVPLGAQKEILAPSALKSLEGRAKIEALLHPLLYAIETLVIDPMDSLLLLLPNLAYFVTPDDGEDSLLQQCLDRVLYPVNSLLGSVTGADTLLEIDTARLLDEALKSLEVTGLDMNLIAQLRIGKLTQYASAADADAWYIRLDADEDKADFLTVLLRAFVDVLKNEENRDKVVDLLADALGLSGFAKTLLGWKLSTGLWLLSALPNGTDMSLRLTLGLAKLMMFFLPAIQWIQRIFGIFG